MPYPLYLIGKQCADFDPAQYEPLQVVVLLGACGHLDQLTALIVSEGDLSDMCILVNCGKVLVRKGKYPALIVLEELPPDPLKWPIKQL